MKTIQRLIFSISLFSSLKIGLTSRCARRLFGEGEISYPTGSFKHRLPKIYRVGENVRENCVLWGKIGWSEESILNITNLSVGTEIEVYQFYEQLNISQKISSRGSIILKRRPFTHFKIIFPKKGSEFRALYSLSRYSALRCSPLKKKGRKMNVSCTHGWKLGSECRTKCNEGYELQKSSSDVDIKFSSFLISCRLNASGHLRWETKQEVVSGEDVLSSEVYSAKSRVLEEYDAECKALKCSNIHKTFEVSQCTEGLHYLSNCTLRCPNGSVPSPQTYTAENFYPSRLSDDWIWTVCRVERGRMQWAPRCTGEFPTISCMGLEDVNRLCLGDPDRLVNVTVGGHVYSSADCPYTAEQLLEFFNEEFDREGYLDPDIPEEETVVPTIEEFQQKVAGLNIKEKQEFNKWIAGSWTGACMPNLLEAIRTENDSAMSIQNVTVDEEKLSDTLSSIMVEHNEGCQFQTVMSCPTSGSLQCCQYCIWENGKRKPCGEFKTKHFMNCLRCSRTCINSEFFGTA